MTKEELTQYKKQWYQENRARIIAEGAAKREDPAIREAARQRAAKWRLENPEKRRAHVASYAETNAKNLAEWRKENTERIRAYAADYTAKNKDRILAWKAEYRKANADKAREYRLANAERLKAGEASWRKANRHLVNARTAERRAALLRATPLWADLAAIEEIYVQAVQTSDLMGELYHVDHIVPLRSKLVCGLHVPANLRVIRGEENQRKGNLYWPDMP